MDMGHFNSINNVIVNTSVTWCQQIVFATNWKVDKMALSVKIKSVVYVEPLHAPVADDIATILQSTLSRQVSYWSLKKVFHRWLIFSYRSVSYQSCSL